MKRIIYVLPLFLLLACKHADTFEIAGTIENASGEMLYLERTTLGKNQVLDSVKLKENGHFRFRQPRPEYPDIYLLSLNNERFYFAIDSTEHLSIKAQRGSLALTDDVEGSEQTAQITALRRSLLTEDMETHKQLQRSTIISNPRSIVAYFALHQTKGGQYVLKMNERDDMACYRAVATAFNTFMPGYYRSKALYQQVLAYINQEKAAANNEYFRQLIADSENTFLDIVLSDENGVEQPLSQYKGKTTIVDFSATGMDNAVAYMFELKELYNKYHSRGLEIYQVSADRNYLLWQQSARNLPWTTVFFDAQSGERCFINYNVQAIPTLFLYNKKGEIVGRYFSFKALEEDVKKWL